MSMESVYLETTFISYLVARPSRDVIVAGHQQTTQEWWANRRSQFECSVSQVVIDEASLGDPAEVQKPLAIIGGLPTLEVTEDAEALTQAIMAAGILPPHAFPDALDVRSSAAVDRAWRRPQRQPGTLQPHAISERRALEAALRIWLGQGSGGAMVHAVLSALAARRQPQPVGHSLVSVTLRR